METIFKRLAFMSIIMFNTLYATPTGTVLDIFDIQVDALNQNFNKNADKIAQSMMQTANLAFELADVNVDPASILNNSGNNVKHDMLTNIVDSVYDAWKIDTRTSLVQNLNKISNAAEAYKNVVGLTRSLGDLEDSAKELGDQIMKNPNIINLLHKKDYKSIAKLTDKGSALYKSLNNIPKLDANILIGLTQKEVANHWQNEIKDEAGQKLYIQELLIKRWQENGTIDRLSIEDVKKLNVYSPIDPGGWAGLFGKRELESTRSLGAAYSLLSPEEINLIENPTIKDTAEVVKKEDSNKDKLANLKTKDKQLKQKLELVKKQEKDLKSKKDRLERIQYAKRDAYSRVKSAEKGSDEYNYAKNRFYELGRDYRALNSDISRLVNSINRNRQAIVTMENSINVMMLNIADTVNDYNDELKTKIVEVVVADTPYTQGEAWLGSVTMNSEDRLPGGATKLRYWGGQFDQSVDEAVVYSGGGPIFNGENEYKIINGKVTSFAIGHGQNTPTDSTKEFHIFNNEIDKTSSFYDDNLNTLKLERQLPGGETLSIQTTGHYDYSAWGEWGQTGGLYTDINGGTGIEQKATHNNWQVGQRTHDLPTQGSATYAGVVNGHYYQGSVGSVYGGKINGTMSMTVDFANTSVVAGVLNLKKEDGATFATAHMDQMQLNRSDSGFAGRLTGVDVNTALTGGSQNMIVGQFNGPSAQEVSGIWNIVNGNSQLATGTFAGKK